MRQAVDIVLSDWNMPGGNGDELLGRIRSSEDDSLRLTKFIMITGAGEKTVEAIDAGANNIIHKPFTAETIKNKLELIFGKLGV